MTPRAINPGMSQADSLRSATLHHAKQSRERSTTTEASSGVAPQGGPTFVRVQFAPGPLLMLATLSQGVSTLSLMSGAMLIRTAAGRAAHGTPSPSPADK
jgi:hypothetical protein